jgi:hypothetical protein
VEEEEGEGGEEEDVGEWVGRGGEKGKERRCEERKTSKEMDGSCMIEQEKKKKNTLACKMDTQAGIAAAFRKVLL